MLRGAKNTVQGCKMAFGTPFLATCIRVALIDQLILLYRICFLYHFDLVYLLFFF